MKKILIGVIALTALGLTACGGGTTPPTPETPVVTPSFTLSDQAVTVVNNGAAVATGINVTRTGGNTEALNFTVTGMPAGLGVVFDKSPISGSEALAGLKVSAVNVPAGEYKLTVTGRSQTVTATARLTVTVTGGSTSPTPVPTPVADVTYVSAAANSTSISVIWSSVTGATGYKLDRKTESGTYSEITTSTTTSYTDTNVTSGTRYIYRVRTVTPNGISAGKEAPIVTFTGTPGGGGTTCCKICRNSKPCGDTCISYDKTCHTPGGCACSGRSIMFVKIKDCPVVTVNALGEEVKIGTVESWLKDRTLLGTK
ncbi:hypothetical protein [Deinococcus sp. Leaf326]|uniref:fibronectin type III domain-containing protein n=1 Tax=Deinococcus sp. Leaf326 TaxID=1736338 RepID=UPI0012E22ED2|nr:hypothetical protein [Deinococcus sp. Leaf326]